LITRIDPLADSRWDKLLETHPQATIFHSAGWLEALRNTYGYQPVVLTTSPADQPLSNGLVFCRVSSWLTGTREVSLPFSDHCDLLSRNEDEASQLMARFAAEAVETRGRYAELRPLNGPQHAGDFCQGQEFLFHSLDLTPSLDQIFDQFHKDSVQRTILRTERAELSLEEGRSAKILRQFYRLLVITRRRHGVPPPPEKWFRNLISSLGDQLLISVASSQGQPIAAILTLKFKDTLVYKYGASDESLHKLGGMSALLWKAIQGGKREGMRSFDLGRSDINNEGLITFKERWGAVRRKICYLRYPARKASAQNAPWKSRAAEWIFSHMPYRVLQKTGGLLYKHVG
jgi:hypothetical protein